ncbi:MAG: efflux RND transporter periplasmic adaptor subunit [Rhodospirillaceae bacterium]
MKTTYSSEYLIIGLVVAVAAAAFWVLRPAAPVSDADRGGRRVGDGRPVPVVPAAVVRQDVPVYLDGLGTVQAYNAAIVRSRVDGELIEWAVREGQEVRAGDVLARLDGRTYQAQLDQALAAKARDEAQLDLARLDLKRYLDLGNRISGQTVDSARAALKQLEAGVRLDQASIDNARTMLSYTVITAPFDGRTGIRQVDRGNIVRASDSGGLVVVAQMQPISVLFTLPQQSLNAINDEMRRQGPLTVLVTDSGNRTVLERGTLELMDNLVDQTTGTVKLKAVFANDQRHLWPGQFVNVRLLLTTRAGSLVVPAAAVLRGPLGPYVFAIKPDQTAEMRPVTLGPVEAGQAVIESGLAEGDAIAVDGVAKLQNGSKVINARRPEGGEAPAGARSPGERPAGEQQEPKERKAGGAAR